MRFEFTDYHVHTNWSHDIKTNGPSFEDYAKIAEKHEINICFLDHFELYYVENDSNYPFYGNKIEQYLAEVNAIKNKYDFVLSGLEVDYYPDREGEIKRFLRDYSKKFDFLAGSIHETAYEHPVTTREKLLTLLAYTPVKKVIDDYFVFMERMIKSNLFNRICHLDTVFRYINRNDISPTPDCDISEERVLKLGRFCVKHGLSIEWNLSGEKFPIARTSPSQEVIATLKSEGADVYVGSDSHSVGYFQEQISKVKKAYKFLNKN